MAATLRPGSSHIAFGAFPHVFRPTVIGGQALFQGSKIEATGSVTLIGSQPAAGWALGFIQVEWVDTNWLYYRGRHNDHGSIFFQRSRPPTRPIKACRDVKAATHIYYEFGGSPPTVTAGDTFPKKLTVHHFDKPGDSAKAVVRNSLTGQDNFIREAQLEFLFCAVLSARDPAGNFHHLKSFYWNVRWQARFQSGIRAAGKATYGKISTFVYDCRFRGDRHNTEPCGSFGSRHRGGAQSCATRRFCDRVVVAFRGVVRKARPDRTADGRRLGDRV